MSFYENIDKHEKMFSDIKKLLSKLVIEIKNKFKFDNYKWAITNL